ncbi:MAG: dCMP deaminase family protein [Candidatus Onthovivens sp.]|nr:dCMP deaminase family protein [Candidatus Onthovivens sp.]
MDRVTWDEYFMTIALLSAKRSKDPSTQVGACIVDNENKVVSIGYNGMPRHCDDTKLTWEKGDDLNSKYLYVCHAEFNAILNTRDGSHLNGCKIYVTLFPCNECAKAIIQTGIKKVIYLSDKYQDQLSTRASKRLFEVAGVEVEQYKGRYTSVELK